jgi:hypothetical protein
MALVPAVSAVAAARPVEPIRSGVDPRTLRADLPEALAADSRTDLSGAARLLEALLSLPTSDTPVLPRPALLAAPPSAGPNAGAQLAGALQDGLQRSGLFYESHLASWLRGELPASALLAEPQGRLPALPPPMAAAPGQAEPALPHGDAPAASLLATLAGVVDARAASIVQQQLIALDTQVLPWQGQVWPGQTLSWTVAPEVDPEQRRSGAQEAPAAWRSRLRMALPGLGEIEAELHWAAQGCQLTVRATDGQLPRLRVALPTLANALEGAGIRAERIVVAPFRDADHD